MPFAASSIGTVTRASKLLWREARRAHGDQHLHRRDIRKCVDRQLEIADRAPRGEAERAKKDEQPLLERDTDQSFKHCVSSPFGLGEFRQQGQQAAGRDALACLERALDGRGLRRLGK